MKRRSEEGAIEEADHRTVSLNMKTCNRQIKQKVWIMNSPGQVRTMKPEPSALGHARQSTKLGAPSFFTS